MVMNTPKIWLGIDPGLAIVGWAVLGQYAKQQIQLKDYGIIETPKTLSTAHRLVEIERDLKALVTEFQPAGIAIEMPFFSRQIKAAGGVMQALGVISLVCYRDAGIDPVFLHQSSWKCHLGSGKASKDEVAAMVCQLFALETLPIDDSVDAIAIAYAGICGLTNEIK
jgi:crossover junction endodeoxyribonuclease RuvC